MHEGSQSTQEADRIRRAYHKCFWVYVSGQVQCRTCRNAPRDGMQALCTCVLNTCKR